MTSSKPYVTSRATSFEELSVPSQQTRLTGPSPPSAASWIRNGIWRAFLPTSNGYPPTAASPKTRSSRAKSRCAIFTTTVPATGCADLRITNAKNRCLSTSTQIEHILPQNQNLSQAWRDLLGEEWQGVQESWLHTLGNLTLTGYNSEYSDRPFAEKRDMDGGFRAKPVCG